MATIIPDTPRGIKSPVRLIANTNITVGNGVTIPATLDGKAPAAGDRILAAYQTTHSQNGIYTVSAAGGATGNITRAIDAVYSEQFTPGFQVPVFDGNFFAGTTWRFANVAAPTLGTSGIDFGQVGANPRWADGLNSLFTTYESMELNSTTLVNVAPMVSGTLYLAGLVVVPAGARVGSLGFMSGTTAASGPTHWWFALIRQSDRAVIATSADQTTTAWAASTAKTLALTTPFVNTSAADATYGGSDLLCYVGVMVAASTTLPSFYGLTQVSTAVEGFGWVRAGLSTISNTTPLARGTIVTAPTSNVNMPYFYTA